MQNMLSKSSFTLEPSGRQSAEEASALWTFGGWFKAVAGSRQSLSSVVWISGGTCRYSLSLQGSAGQQVSLALLGRVFLPTANSHTGSK
jgi:hypothetical protein